MPRQTTNTNSQTRWRSGFSMMELLITATVITTVTAFGLIGITRARAAVRLSGAAREYASYIERARIFSIRRHADDASQRARVAINDDRTSYDVALDLDGDGNLDTRTVNLPSGVTFETVETIAFDWRGRTWNTVGGVTSPNAQVSIRLVNSDGSISVDVTGSGDITIDSRVFDDSVPNVNLRIGDLALGATPVPTPYVIESPTPDTGTLPIETPDVTVSPTPLPIDGGGVLPISTPTPSPVSTPTPSPTPKPRATATPTPTPVLCTINADLSIITMSQEGTATVKISHNGSSNVSISASSSKPSDLQVSPGGSQSIAPGNTGSFTIKSKKSSGTFTVTFSAGCGTKVVTVIVL